MSVNADRESRICGDEDAICESLLHTDRLDTETVSPAGDAGLKNGSTVSVSVVAGDGVAENGNCVLRVLPDVLSTNRILFTVDSKPPWYIVMAYALQQVVGMLSGPVTASFIIQTCICATDNQQFLAELIGLSFVMAGLCTLLQVTIGVRLPIMQGSSFSFLAIFIAWRNVYCPNERLAVDVTYRTNDTQQAVNDTTTQIEEEEHWKTLMRMASGGIVLSSMVEILLGCTGAIGLLMRFIGPLTLCPTLALIGLSLFAPVADKAQEHWGVAILTAGVFLICALFLTDLNVPIPGWTRSRGFHVVSRYPLFRLFPQVLAIAVGWIVCIILTKTNHLPSEPTLRGYKARTDVDDKIIAQQNWFFIPYPGMWGWPTFTFSVFMAMLAATVGSILESIGDYYAAARACGEPAPPKHAINRGIAMEGLGSLICGLLGAGHATTSYTSPAALIPITGMASRYTFQFAGLFLLLAGMFGKFGAILSCIPAPVLGGVSLMSFAMIIGLGLSYLGAVDLHSTRNLFITGLALIFGIMIPGWMAKNPTAVQTGFAQLDQTLTMFMSTPMFVGGVLAFILDNAIPGTLAERGLDHHTPKDTSSSSDRIHIYDLPLSDRCSACYNKLTFLTYLPFLPCYVERQFPLQCKTVRGWFLKHRKRKTIALQRSTSAADDAAVVAFNSQLMSLNEI